MKITFFATALLFSVTTHAQIARGSIGSVGYWWGRFDSPDHNRSEWDIHFQHGYESDLRGGKTQDGNLLFGPLLAGFVVAGIGDGVDDAWYTALDLYIGGLISGGGYLGYKMNLFIPYLKYQREYLLDALHMAEGPLFFPFSYGLDLLGGGILIPNLARAEFQYGSHAATFYKYGWDERYAKDLRFLASWEADPKNILGLQLDFETRNGSDYFRKVTLVYLSGFGN